MAGRTGVGADAAVYNSLIIDDPLIHHLHNLSFSHKICQIMFGNRFSFNNLTISDFLTMRKSNSADILYTVVMA
jgi:hypothetical protein